MSRGRVELIDLTGDNDGTESIEAHGSRERVPCSRDHTRWSGGAAAPINQRSQGAAGSEAAHSGLPGTATCARPSAKSHKRVASAVADASQASAAARSTTTAQKQPKAKRQKKEPPEKRQNEMGRTVPYSRQPSQKVQERMERAMPGSGHRMCVLEQHTVAGPLMEGGPIEEYALLGATGNVYTVRIGRHPSCSCPDARKGNLCKHHLYIMLRVLRLARDDPCVWQRALLTAEAREVLSGQRSMRAVPGAEAADPRLQEAFRAATAGSHPAAAASPAPPQRPLEGDCPICYDELTDGGNGSAGQKSVVTCSTCHNHIHAHCFATWVKAKGASAVTCVYCRSPWPNAHADAGLGASAPAAGVLSAGRRGGSSYINLLQQSQAHANTDTSLDTLYGANAVWIRHHQGNGSRYHAAQMWNALR